MNFTLFDKTVDSVFLTDATASTGLKKVASKVVSDYNRVTGKKASLKDTSDALLKADTAVFFGIVGDSPVLQMLEDKGLASFKDLKGKWECYKFLSLHTDSIKNLLVIAGSDKLGAIYGAFTLSEKMGISPLSYWADTVVKKASSLKISFDAKASKEPSVQYRGFFINDEWPCYGNWTTDHFGGFTAEMYDHVFELLLRLKGNYLWPAMWSSCFSLDGPGLLSYELASEYGIFIGNSHHEPCLRAGEEYSKVRGKGSIYGDAWNYHANTEGITRFWKDSLDERGGFESIVTIGMRGEADSTILGADSTLKDNIDLLKDVIRCQNKLIAETEKKYNKKFTKMLALYKEVEPFYYGDKDTEGLCDWPDLEDTILMLCEDNQGYLRTVPDAKMRKHKGGFGMYYHVDYHGDPISYEWINSTPLTTIWEQMSQAYDYGIKKLWILNVGDLKHNEFPLSYFMNLAFDFEKWGTKAPNSTFEYTKQAVSMAFGNGMSDAKVTTASEILTEQVRLNGMRRPETLNPFIYHPCHFGEADKMLARCDALEAKAKKFEKTLSSEEKTAWYSLCGFQVKATVNLLRMHLYAGKNRLFAAQGLKSANTYADLCKKAIETDEALKTEWRKFHDGKWTGMEMAPHIGFIKWNEDGSRYPVVSYVHPYDRPRLFVMKEDDERVYDKKYGPLMNIDVKDFCFEGFDTVKIKVANTGKGFLDMKVEMPDCKWLSMDGVPSKLENEHVITFFCDRSKLSDNLEEAVVKITGGDTSVLVTFTGKKTTEKLPKGTVLPGPFGYSVMASDYVNAYAPEKTEWVSIEDYGIFEHGIKVYPDTFKFKKGDEPYSEYFFYAEEDGEYTLNTDFAPTNPLSRKNLLRYAVSVNDGKDKVLDTVPRNYKAGSNGCPEWGKGTLDHRHSCYTAVNLKKGVNSIKVKMVDPGMVLLKLSLYKDNPPASYLGIPATETVK